VVFEHTGGKAFVFSRPDQQFFFDIEDKVRYEQELARIDSGESKIGVVEATFRQCIKSAKVGKLKAPLPISGETMKKKAGSNAPPIVGIAAGRQVRDVKVHTSKVDTMSIFGTLRVYAKPAKAIRMLKAQSEGRVWNDDDEQADEQHELLEKKEKGRKRKPVVPVEIDLTADIDSDEDGQRLKATRV